MVGMLTAASEGARVAASVGSGINSDKFRSDDDDYNLNKLRFDSIIGIIFDGLLTKKSCKEIIKNYLEGDRKVSVKIDGNYPVAIKQCGFVNKVEVKIIL